MVHKYKHAKESHTEDEFMEFVLNKRNYEVEATEMEYKPFYVISTAESLQYLVREFKETTKIDEPNRDSYLAKVLTVPLLLALATELGLKALYYQETKKNPLQTHDLIELFKALGEDTQAEFESAFEKLGKNTRARFEAMVPKPKSNMLQYVLDENKDVFVNWRYSFEHSFLQCNTKELDEVVSAVIETYHKLFRSSSLQE